LYVWRWVGKFGRFEKREAHKAISGEKMKFSEFSDIALPKIENKMKEILALTKIDQDTSLNKMLSYHLGLGEEEPNHTSQGKRIRPLILLLTTETAGGKWENALAAAAAIELLHNFSLIHDDIEDQSEYRRGRLTLWKKYNLPLSLNAGDALYALSFVCLSDLQRTFPDNISFQAYQLLSLACLSITKGQHKDIAFEKAPLVSTDEYLEMIEGKTAALLATSTQLGALLAESDKIKQDNYYYFGKNLGLAFQIYDDILGIWGNPKETGKSVATDLNNRKKSLPILYGLAQNQTFKNMWEKEITADSIQALSSQLKAEGAYEYSLRLAEFYTSAAVKSFHQTEPTGPMVEAFEELIENLTNRKS
jgi:geranylgeranyl diphosphate synthase type I